MADKLYHDTLGDNTKKLHSKRPSISDKEWRPKNWLNPVQMRDFDDVGVCQGHKELYEAGASAMLKALIKYLWGKCDNPDHIPAGFLQRDNAVHSNAIPYRKDCPQCMEQFGRLSK
jgi:hypothetical protein